MKVYLLFFSHENMFDVIDVFADKQKADQAANDLKTQFSGSTKVDIFFIEKEIVE